TGSVSSKTLWIAITSRSKTVSTNWRSARSKQTTGRRSAGGSLRAEFAQSIIGMYEKRPDFVFMSGDLGYMALEKVIETYGERFINIGVAEQNMISVAAGLAYEGFTPWVYSIAPFA